MKLYRTLTAKLILLTVGTLFIMLVSIFIISRVQLTKIIDRSQLTLYEEKINIIIKELERTNERLKKTGLRDVYVDDFQTTLLNNIRETYYTEEDITIFPFIINWDLSIILHPVQPRDSTILQENPEFYRLKIQTSNNMYASYMGIRKWYIYKHFDPWNWIIVFAVPEKEKYADITRFLNVLLYVMIVLSGFFTPLLILLSYSVTIPIVELTKITKRIARGELDQTIPVKNRDEVGVLAESITVMQQSIKEKLEALNREMEEKNKMEEQLIQSRKMDAIGQLAGGVAHDFNNMLGGISGAAQLLSLDKNITGESRKYVEMILTTSDRAAELTGQLLAFGRKKVYSTSQLNIHRIIQDTLILLERTLDKKIHIELRNNARDSFFIGNTSAIQNSIMNLAINAAHAMPEGGELTISTENIFLDDNYCRFSSFEIEPGQYIDLIVEDTGAGIEPELMDKIFEPFYTSKGLGKGTGLGLSLVYGTIQQHKGAITVYSEWGRGTVFHIYLPCSDEEQAVLMETIPRASESRTASILLVDDEEIIRETGKSLLERMGYKVTLAENGNEALAQYSRMSGEIDLIITDMIMPQIGGKEVFLKIHEIDPQCPFIITSGLHNHGEMEEIQRIGKVGFLQKPFRQNELNEAIQTILK